MIYTAERDDPLQLNASVRHSKMTMHVASIS
jgi:hypothetical protein